MNDVLKENMKERLASKKSQLKRARKRRTFHSNQLVDLIEEFAESIEGTGNYYFLQSEIDKTINIIASFEDEIEWLESEIDAIKKMEEYF